MHPAQGWICTGGWETGTHPVTATTASLHATGKFPALGFPQVLGAHQGLNPSPRGSLVPVTESSSRPCVPSSSSPVKAPCPRHSPMGTPLASPRNAPGGRGAAPQPCKQRGQGEREAHPCRQTMARPDFPPAPLKRHGGGLQRSPLQEGEKRRREKPLACPPRGRPTAGKRHRGLRDLKGFARP